MTFIFSLEHKIIKGRSFVYFGLLMHSLHLVDSWYLLNEWKKKACFAFEYRVSWKGAQAFIVLTDQRYSQGRTEGKSNWAPRTNGRCFNWLWHRHTQQEGDRRLLWDRLTYSQHISLPKIPHTLRPSLPRKTFELSLENSRDLLLNQHHHACDVDQVHNVQQKPALWNLWTAAHPLTIHVSFKQMCQHLTKISIKWQWLEF